MAIYNDFAKDIQENKDDNNPSGLSSRIKSVIELSPSLKGERWIEDILKISEPVIEDDLDYWDGILFRRLGRLEDDLEKLGDFNNFSDKTSSEKSVISDKISVAYSKCSSKEEEQELLSKLFETGRQDTSHSLSPNDSFYRSENTELYEAVSKVLLSKLNKDDLSKFLEHSYEMLSEVESGYYGAGDKTKYKEFIDLVYDKSKDDSRSSGQSKNNGLKV